MTEQTTSRRDPSPSRKGPHIGTQGATGYIWLAYSVFFFLDPFFRRDPRYWAECLAIYAIFLAIYVGFLNTRASRQRYMLIAAFYVLGLIAYPINSGASSFFIYAAAFLPFVLESGAILSGILTLFCAGVVAEGLWFHLNTISIFATMFFLIVVGAADYFMARQKRMDCKLRAAQEENAQLAAVAERERIARDLHDVLGHTLSVIVLKAELAKRLIEHDPQRAAQEIADVESTARTALAEVRETIGGYRSKGFAAELAHARRTLDAAGVALTWEVPHTGLPALTTTEETVLSLSVREAVTNIVRHAEATCCTMRLNATSDGFYALLVEDDGPHAIQCEGNGLRGMRERVASFGGRFSIRSDRGTHLLIELPINNSTENTFERGATA